MIEIKTSPGPHLTRFDGLALLVMAGLVLAILGTIWRGDRVGVQVERYGPTAATSSLAQITLTFSESMNRDSVLSHLQITPPINGDFTWRGRTLRLAPAEPLPPGATYQVSLRAGAESTNRRPVLHALDFSFQVRAPRIAYLKPADAAPANIWLAPVDQPGDATQITFSPTGIVNFAAHPDGSVIALAEHTDAGPSDIKLLDLETGAIQQVTNCADSQCDTPVWRPDGTMLAYHRMDLNTEMSELGISSARVWLVDLTTMPYTNRPLFTDNQILGFGPQWSADGRRLAVFDANSDSVYIHDFSTDSIQAIPLGSTSSHVALSPDGQQLAFARMMMDDETSAFRFDLHLVDIETGAERDVFGPDEPVDDRESAWNPDGRHLVLARRYTDARSTRNRQLFLLDTQTGATQELVFDADYFNGFFAWNPPGTQLAIYRFPELAAGEAGRPEVWVYDLAADQLTQIAENAYLPQWVP